MTIERELVDMGACDTSRSWLRRNKGKTKKQLWAACRRGDWMWWWLRKRPGGIAKKTSVAFARWCSARAKAHAASAAWAASASSASYYADDAAAASRAAYAAADAADAADRAAYAAADRAAWAAAADAYAAERLAQAEWIRENVPSGWSVKNGR
jgi:hypothetical protein